jgi:hypothetical protein
MTLVSTKMASRTRISGMIQRKAEAPPLAVAAAALATAVAAAAAATTQGWPVATTPAAGAGLAVVAALRRPASEGSGASAGGLLGAHALAIARASQRVVVGTGTGPPRAAPRAASSAALAVASARELGLPRR